MGLFKKKVTVGSTISEVTGYGPFKRSISSAWSYQKSMAVLGYDLFRDAISVPRLNFTVDSTIKDVHARFKNAAQLSGNAGVLSEMETAINNRARFWLIVFVAAIMFGLAGLNSNGILYNAIVGKGLKAALILPFVISLVFLGRWIRWSFWSYQMREKALWNFRKWLFSPSEWISGKQLSSGVKFMLFFAVSMTLLNGTIDPAIAQQLPAVSGGGGAVTQSGVQSSLLGNLNSSDLSLQFLENLFPSYFSNTTGVSYSDDAVAQMMEAINLTLLSIGSLLVFWFTTHAVVASASEGTVLGQRWHTVWVPVRITTGVAATVPFHGFCAAQLIMMQIVLAGCGLANLAWSNYIQYATGNGGHSIVAITVPPQVTSDDGTFNTILNDALCVKVGQYVYSTKNAPTVSKGGIYALPLVGWIGAHVFGESDTTSAFNMPTSPTVSKNSTVYNFGPACGSVTLNKTDDFSADIGQHMNDMKPSGTNVVVNVPPGFNQDKAAQQAADQFMQAKQDAMSKFIQQVVASPVLDDLASSVVSGGKAVQQGETFADMNKLREDYAAYNGAVLKAASTAVSASNVVGLQIIQSMANTLGWASAGALEPQLIAISAKVDSIMSQQPSFTKGKPDSINNKQFNEALSSAWAQVMDEESTSPNLAPMNPGAKSNNSSVSSLAGDLVANPRNGGDDLMGWIYSNYIGSLQDATPSAVDPLQSISSEGMWAKSSGYAILGAGIVLGGIKGGANGSIIASLTPGVSAGKGVFVGILAVIIPMIITLGEMLIVAGCVMEYVLPMLPYFIWVSAFVGYMVFVIEAVICAAFWGFSHIKADGEDSFAGQAQSYGYGVALIAIFYPTLMVIGLIMANVLLAAVITFISQTFVLAQGSSSGNIFDPLGFITVFIAMMVFYFSMIARCYRLISGLPEWCSRWFGISASIQRDDTHGEAARFGENMQSNLSGKASQMGVGQAVKQNLVRPSKGPGPGPGS